MAYYRRADACLLCYEIGTPMEQLKERVQYWMNELNNNVHSDSCFVVLVGTKSDLGRNNVTQEELIKLYPTRILTHITTSAKTGEGVAELFDYVGCQLIALRAPVTEIQVPNQPTQETKSSCC